MERRILITQCLQNDFIKPIGKYDPIPNALHIGHSEAMRLVGEDPAASPLNQVMNWAYARPPDALEIIHIRDWHDGSDAEQADHLKHFSPHCLKDSDGARFIFEAADRQPGRPVQIVNSLTLNDFIGTNLQSLLTAHESMNTKAGLIGVWTEAKITYLAYELRTRFPWLKLAVCSALTASSTRSQHYAALNHLQRILGVDVIDSVGEFVRYLGGGDFGVSRPMKTRPELDLNNAKLDFPVEAQRLTEYLFRDCASVNLKVLDGGFSGNFVFGCESLDHEGRAQVSHVLKIGKRELVAKERTAFEKVEPVLGNTAPRIVDFADSQTLGAIKYRYASMGGGPSKSFQKVYMGGASTGEISRIVGEVFSIQLGRLYMASRMESCNLLDYYGFRGDMADRVQILVDQLTEKKHLGPTIPFFGRTIPNPAHFYSSHVERLKTSYREQRYFSHIHGDLNGANIIVDANRNVWLIDFFHTQVGHVLQDLIKLENDLLYIFTPVRNESDLKLAMDFTDALLDVKDLATPPSFPARLASHRTFGRAAKTVRTLRRFYAGLLYGDLDALQLMIGQLRYAAHTLSFDEPNIWQRRWALYTAGLLSSAVAERADSLQNLRIAWVPLPKEFSGRLGITLLPGRRDRERNLEDDLEIIKAAGVRHVYALLTSTELKHYGVPGLIRTYKDAGLFAEQVQIHDGQPPTAAESKILTASILKQLKSGENVLLHCVGGLGRSGTVAASLLIHLGLNAEDAIARIRECRSPRAIETKKQEAFLRKLGR